jgi:radical SAM superfamily enzyme YgiQ (UPF0313 family)
VTNDHEPVRVLLISTYELGRQPFGLASPAAWLREAGFDVVQVDLSRQPLDRGAASAARLIAFFLPMHTATRLAVPVIEHVRALNPRAALCAYGLYAPPNAALLRSLDVATVLGGEFEAELLALAEVIRHEGDGDGGLRGSQEANGGEAGRIPHLRFRVPDRTGLPPLDAYARLNLPDGSQRVVGYTEASRGCRHRCRHCPVVPVYDGRFRAVPAGVVLEDVRRQVAAGARHVTFGDPDFFNGIGHAMRVVDALARECPGVTYDVTIKVEHLVRYARYLPRLAATGCLFVTTAVESIDDDVLVALDKGHTRADFEGAVSLCRAAGLAIVPTFVAFTPWTTVQGYARLLDAIAALDLAGHVAPIQLAIRLLIPNGSRLLELEAISRLVRPFDPRTLTWPWSHPDPAVDGLQAEVEALVAGSARACREATFERVRAIVATRRGDGALPVGFAPGVVRPRTDVPWLDEPWYC